MSIAGQDDERPGDEVEGIRYFDFTDPAEPRPRDVEADPFATEGLPDPHEPPAPRERPAPRATPAPPASEERADVEPTDPFEFALTGAPSPRPAPRPKPGRSEAGALEPETAPPPEQSEERPTHIRFFELASLFEPRNTEADSRERFAAAFDAARAEHGVPFLAIALRMPPHATASAHFPIVADGIRSALHPGDVLLADEARLRLVAVLRGRQAAEARALFTHLKDHLRMWLDDADDVLHAISALAAPDGRPFEDADAFLAHTFAGD